MNTSAPKPENSETFKHEPFPELSLTLSPNPNAGNSHQKGPPQRPASGHGNRSRVRPDALTMFGLPRFQHFGPGAIEFKMHHRHRHHVDPAGISPVYSCNTTTNSSILLLLLRILLFLFHATTPATATATRVVKQKDCFLETTFAYMAADFRERFLSASPDQSCCGRNHDQFNPTSLCHEERHRRIGVRSLQIAAACSGPQTCQGPNRTLYVL